MLFAILLSSVLTGAFAQPYKYSTEVKTYPPEDSPGTPEATKDGIAFETVAAPRMANRGVPTDNGGNYGDLIYRYRENKDRLLLREVVINQVLTSTEQDIKWYASIPGARISSVRVLNFGRERAYCLRIDVAGGDVQTFLRIPPLTDPRVMVEVYGF